MRRPSPLNTISVGAAFTCTRLASGGLVESCSPGATAETVQPRSQLQTAHETCALHRLLSTRSVRCPEHVELHLGSADVASQPSTLRVRAPRRLRSHVHDAVSRTSRTGRCMNTERSITDAHRAQPSA